MNKETMAILKLVSDRKITVEEANSLLQALKETDQQARSHRFKAGYWGEYTIHVIHVLKSFAETSKKHLDAVKVDSFKNLKGLLREQKRSLNRTLREMAHEFKQLTHR